MAAVAPPIEQAVSGIAGQSYGAPPHSPRCPSHDCRSGIGREWRSFQRRRSRLKPLLRLFRAGRRFESHDRDPPPVQSSPARNPASALTVGVSDAHSRTQIFSSRSAQSSLSATSASPIASR